MSRSRNLAGICVALAALAITAPQIAAAQIRARVPRITVKPNDVMVNTLTTVRGTGFPRNASVALRECGHSFWIAPQSPCNTGNAISVRTNRRGSFTASFKAEVCPEGEAPRIITERICYIGVPKVSLDSVALAPVTTLIVTYP